MGKRGLWAVWLCSNFRKFFKKGNHEKSGCGEKENYIFDSGLKTGMLHEF